MIKKLDQIDLSPEDFNIRRDLMAFVHYAWERDIKRSHRENLIPKSDLKRLIKILQPPEILRDLEPTEGHWAEWISELARNLGLISYDIKGSYIGYHSTEPAFPDNYIAVNELMFKEYMELKPSDKERTILKALIHHNKNEFHFPSLLGTQGRFDGWGSGVNAASRMDLPSIRQRLLEMLADYEPGKIIPFEKFVQRIKTTEPDLIINSKAEQAYQKKIKNRFAEKPKEHNKYECFLEHRIKTNEDVFYRNREGRKEINEKDLDAFERVEGRYLAFFLEEIPVLMQFVRLQYHHSKNDCMIPPPAGIIQSFTVHEKLRSIIQKRSSNFDRVTVTVLPDYTVIVEAPLYPDRELAQLDPFTKHVSTDKHVTTLRIDRKKTVDYLAANPSTPTLRIVLDEMVDKIPPNVAHEIDSWTNMADRFVIYEEVGLLEFTDSKNNPSESLENHLDKLIWEKASSRFAILHDPEDAFQMIEKLEQVPIKIKHSKNTLRQELLRHSSAGNRSGSGKGKRKKPLEKAKLIEIAFVAYRVENKKLLTALTKHLCDAGINPVLIDNSNCIITVPDAARSHIRASLKKLSDLFEIEVK